MGKIVPVIDKKAAKIMSERTTRKQNDVKLTKYKGRLYAYAYGRSRVCTVSMKIINANTTSRKVSIPLTEDTNDRLIVITPPGEVVVVVTTVVCRYCVDIVIQSTVNCTDSKRDLV